MNGVGEASWMGDWVPRRVNNNVNNC